MRRWFVVPVILALSIAACGDDSPEAAPTIPPSLAPTTEVPSTVPAPTTAVPTTAVPTTAPTLTAADLAAVGPYPVGVTTRMLATGNGVEVWYPAGPDAEGETDTYAVRDFTPEVMRELVPDEINDRLTIDAGRDASVAEDGPFPLVLFSHGVVSFRLQSSRLAHHLASWGMVVASADHPTRNLVNLLTEPVDPPSSTDDLLATWALVVADDVLGASVDGERIAVSGHSAGGGTALSVAATPGISGYISYASGAFSDAALPDVPSMFMAGALDTIAEPSRTQAAYDAAPSPSWYVEFAASGHLAFTDLCAVGDGSGTLIDLAEAAGLQDFLTDGIRRLGTDGCEAPNRPVEEVWPGIHQASTGFLRWVFGLDAEPIGTDAPAVDGVVTDRK